MKHTVEFDSDEGTNEVKVSPYLPDDRSAIEELLRGEALPIDGFSPNPDSTIVARDEHGVVGSATVVPYRRDGLLRSLVVAPTMRKLGLGRLLTDSALELASAAGIKTIYLLAESAGEFFLRLGFEVITRSEVPPGVASDTEFTRACPASATVMVRSLGREGVSPLFDGLDKRGAADFAEPWLAAWTGNDPDRLLTFYAENAYYSDPQVPLGLRGHVEIRPYLEALLARFPDWVWRHVDSDPLPDGFLNHWEATIPLQASTVVCRGVCTVQLSAGKIVRNEVFFDRSELLERLKVEGEG